MRSVVITFPGSNCDRDMREAVTAVTGAAPASLWHGNPELPAGVDLVILPGGFSYGDHLRCGAVASRSPVMQAVKKHAEEGGYVLGVCNGFQILTEAGLLPGVLLRNNHLRFVCDDVKLKVCRNDTAFTAGYAAGAEITVPVAHHDGNYFADPQTLARLEGENRIAFRYADDAQNPNGSAANIAGVYSGNLRVLGMMPHPERAADAATGGTDGAALFTSLLQAVAREAA